MNKKNQDTLKYNEMLQRMEKIISNLSAAPMDLDQVIEKVEEGYDLIEQMRLKLDSAKTKVGELQAKFTTADKQV